MSPNFPLSSKINIAKVEPVDYSMILKKIDGILPHIYDLKGREIIEAMQEIFHGM
jgi:hypothetical protein